MKYDVEPITTAIKNLDMATITLSSSIESDWNDEVKDSYKKYISQCKEIVNRIKTLGNTIKTECDRMSNTDVNGLIDSAKSTCYEIDRF